MTNLRKSNDRKHVASLIEETDKKWISEQALQIGFLEETKTKK